jgi:hypothetical protein
MSSSKNRKETPAVRPWEDVIDQNYTCRNLVFWVKSVILILMKKASGYIVTALILIAVSILVYTFVKNGLLGIGPQPSAVSDISTSNPVSSIEPTQATGSTISNKMTSDDKISLVVTSPVDGSTLTSTNVTVKGKTTPNADVFVNDQTGKADANGNFAISVGLDEGANQIVVSANDSVGNATQQTLSVTVVSFQ